MNGSERTVRRYRKRPVEIEAIRYFPRVSCAAVYEFMGMPHTEHDCDDPFSIVTLEGAMRVIPGDWIIKGVAGEFYPCKPQIFEATYELVEEVTRAPIDHDDWAEPFR